MWPGEGGMALLKYIGQAPNRRMWTGQVTGIRYPFGPGEVRWVDKRDAQVWLNPKRGDGKAFERDNSESDQAGSVQREGHLPQARGGDEAHD